MTSRPSDIVVVSGLPRSGTSLMMQMLVMGGMEALTDRIRAADTDNPKGYFEFEQVKKLKQDTSWLPSARGKVVKMISALLYDLPSTETYRVIFMRRDMDEILESQEKMLARLGRPAQPRDQIRRSYQIHLDKLFQWLESCNYIEQMEVSYNKLLMEPETIADQIRRFLSDRLDLDRMVEAIDHELYRNRKAR